MTLIILAALLAITCSAWLGLRRGKHESIRPSPTSPEELAKWKYTKRIPDVNWPDGSPMFKDCWIVSNDKQP